MSYIYCDACGIGFHSNVHSCPECGRPARHIYDADPEVHRHHHHHLHSHAPKDAPREEVESEVREAIYGWHSGTVERCAGVPLPDEDELTEPSP